MNLTREYLDGVVEVMLSNPANDPDGVPVVDLAEALDLIDRHSHIAVSFYAIMQKLVAQRRVVMTQPTPYSRWRAFAKPLTPTQYAAAKRRLLAQFKKPAEKPIDTPIRAEAIDNDQQRLFVIEVSLEEADSSLIVVHADDATSALRRARAWIKHYGVRASKLACREYAAVNVLL